MVEVGRGGGGGVVVAEWAFRVIFSLHPVSLLRAVWGDANRLLDWPEFLLLDLEFPKLEFRTLTKLILEPKAVSEFLL